MAASTFDAGRLSLVRADDGDELYACQRCGSTVRVGRILRSTTTNRKTERVRLCAECLCQALDKVTGINFSGQYARWTAFSSQASELAERSHRSARARRQTGEQRAAARRRTEGEW